MKTRDKHIYELVVSSPKTEDIESLLKQTLTKIKEEFIRDEQNKDYCHLIVKGAYPTKVLDLVIKLYKASGWERVKCKTSSENNEQPSLTIIIKDYPLIYNYGKNKILVDTALYFNPTTNAPCPKALYKWLVSVNLPQSILWREITV